MLTLIAAVSGEQVVNTVIWIVVVGLVFWLLTYLVGAVGLPEPFAKVARTILLVAGVLFLISVLLDLAGHPIINWR